MTLKPRRWRTATIGLAAVLALPLGAGGQPAAAAPAKPAKLARIDQKVADRLAQQDKATFWVFMTDKADLSGAAKLHRKADKAGFVYRTKTDKAAHSQAGLRDMLTRQHVDFKPFWLANTIKVTGDRKLVNEIAARSDVAEILADDPVTLPDPSVGAGEPTVNGVEWNIDRINAPRVWNELGVRGEGIVVANIDSGVDYTHPAVNGSYRGHKADGTYDHNYNWFDPAGVCPTDAPCDNNDHGTHTMGTMVGADGTNVIGVAPGAKWIAAKGCESNSCTRESLLAAGQWVVAPTDLNGANPRPDLAPDVVNNSWGASAYDPWYTDTVAAWMAAGIFPAFSNGNSGPGCNTAGSPGSYSISYASGAFDANNAIASFSSRGAGENGDIKPNIAAPGVNVRSSIPGGYDVFSGTSMASPHTAATVALMWSASPALQGDVAATKQLLDDTAIDVNNLSCGGTVDDNNVFGEGRLDAFLAVSNTPRGALGAVVGHVTSGGAALAGATVTAAGPLTRTATTAADGSYSFGRLMVGDYTVTVSKFGYVTGTATVAVAENDTATVDVTVAQAPSATLSGTVSTSAGAAGGASVTIGGTPLSTVADAQGHYSIVAPQGGYDVTAQHAYKCADAVTRHVELTGDTTLDIVLPDRTDTFGYACGAAGGSWVPGTTQLALTGDDATAAVNLPFAVALYGKTYRSGYVSTNGVFGFGAVSTSYSNGTLPSTAAPNLALYPFWDDLFVEADSSVWTAVTGAKPHRTFTVEWRNVAIRADRTQRISFSAAIGEDGLVTYRYKDIDGTGAETGNAATIGLENATGSDAFQYSYNASAVATGSAIAFRTTKTGVLSGTVTDANDGQPVADATVTVTAGGQSASATTGPDGTYIVQGPSGAVSVGVAKANYESATGAGTLTAGGVAELTTALRTARVSTATTGLAVIVPAGQTRDRQLTLTNTGGLGTAFTVAEVTTAGDAADIGWLTLTGTSGNLASGASATVGVRLDPTGLTAGTYHQAVIRITSASGRTPVLTVPVTLVVPSYVKAVDAGSKSAHADLDGETWTPDQAYTAGGAGYLGNSTVVSTTRTVTGADDQSRFANLREGMYEYRFDGLADGTYTIELNFAELKNQTPDKRVFDVLIEGQEVLPSLDIAGEVGSYSALTKTFTVHVTDGQLNVRFVTHKGFSQPLVNALRVTNRPDLQS